MMAIALMPCSVRQNGSKEGDGRGWERERETNLFLDLFCGSFDFFLVYLRDLTPVDLQSSIHEEMRAFQYYTPPASTTGRCEQNIRTYYA